MGSRHNRGREVVEELARRWRVELDVKECGSRLSILDRVILAIPETYMNRSGFAARCLLERRGFEPQEMLIVYDEVALPLGSLRLRHKGGAGGQNGMASVLESLRTESVPRMRLGVGPADAVPGGVELVDYVLSPFKEKEMEIATEQIQRAADACELWLEQGTEAAMNRFNSLSASGASRPADEAATESSKEEED